MESDSKLRELIHAINYDYVHLAYHAERYVLSGDEPDSDAKQELIQSILELNALHMHIQDLLDILHPRLQTWL